MYFKTGTEQRISSIESSKNTIILSDGSKWKATGIHSYKISLWLPTHKVIVEKSGLNYKITNINKDVTVDAEHLS
ncbi:hypothetical protein KA005_71695 [bacterium]|nr:hypothetical protein [bacterium]